MPQRAAKARLRPDLPAQVIKVRTEGQSHG
jgi:hypothetical protein